MYVLTIVFLVSQVSITSLHASKEVCERVAERALLTNVGPQAVASAKCEPQVLAASKPGASPDLQLMSSLNR